MGSVTMGYIVAIVGAGVMGRGVAQVLAQHDFDVLLMDLTGEVLDEAQRSIGYALKSAALFHHALRERHEATLARIETTTNYEGFAEADFVIENATEDWSVKETVYAELGRHCRPDCTLAANTSAISIARIASLVPNPSRVIGMHFMNPVPRKPLVEVIRSPATSDAAVAAAIALLERIGKQAIIVGDSPGFVTNRVLMLMINEAIGVVEEGISNARDVDAIFTGCFSHAMGPLATADLIGLDTILRSLEVLESSFDDPKFAARPLLREMVGSGRLGRKTGAGFFEYKARSRDQ
jgi:3-hydroxybutyryl-CoA dehydrogenase